LRNPDLLRIQLEDGVDPVHQRLKQAPGERLRLVEHAVDAEFDSQLFLLGLDVDVRGSFFGPQGEQIVQDFLGWGARADG
jgi:hypothetical protein